MTAEATEAAGRSDPQGRMHLVPSLGQEGPHKRCVWRKALPTGVVAIGLMPLPRSTCTRHVLWAVRIHNCHLPDSLTAPSADGLYKETCLVRLWAYFVGVSYPGICPLFS